jgi:hypothetical protein
MRFIPQAEKTLIPTFSREREKERAGADLARRKPSPACGRGLGEGLLPQMWIGRPVTAIAASLIASEWVGWAWQV